MKRNPTRRFGRPDSSSVRPEGETMKQTVVGVVVGVLSGLCTYEASIYALARTSSLVKPRGFPMMFWQPLIVFGLGAFAVALVIHVLALRLSSSRVLPTLAGFLATLIGTLAVSGLLATAHEALLAWPSGAVLASVLCVWLRSNSSSRRTGEKPHVA